MNEGRQDWSVQKKRGAGGGGRMSQPTRELEQKVILFPATRTPASG